MPQPQPFRSAKAALCHLLSALLPPKKEEGGKKLTTRNNRPRRVHAGVVAPIIHSLGPAVRQAAHVLGEPARAVVQRHAVQVAHADHRLQQVAQGSGMAAAAAGRQEGGEQREGAPCYLIVLVMGKEGRGDGDICTTVRVSMQSMKGSEVR